MAQTEDKVEVDLVEVGSAEEATVVAVLVAGTAAE